MRALFSKYLQGEVYRLALVYNSVCLRRSCSFQPFLAVRLRNAFCLSHRRLIAAAATSKNCGTVPETGFPRSNSFRWNTRHTPKLTVLFLTAPAWKRKRDEKSSRSMLLGTFAAHFSCGRGVTDCGFSLFARAWSRSCNVYNLLFTLKFSFSRAYSYLYFYKKLYLILLLCF